MRCDADVSAAPVFLAVAAFSLPVVAFGQLSQESDERAQLKDQVRSAFAAAPRPANSELRDSSEGDEPYLLEKEFSDKKDWQRLDANFLDQAPGGYSSALSFFTSKAFRYYLPAYLIADVDGLLEHAEPTFHLWYGLDDKASRQKVNPQRYGDWTWAEATRQRFAAFTQPEARAIVAYLRYKAKRNDFDRPKIEQALRNYWLSRAGESPLPSPGERPR